jgi:hypothetical protein
MMGTPLEHSNFSRYSLFPLRSAPLRASIIGTFPSSNGAERNTFDNDGNTTWTLQFLKIFIISPPLRSAPCLNHCPVPTERSGTILHFPPWKNTLKNSFSNFEGWKIFNPFIESCFVSFHQELLTSIRFSMGTPLEHCNFSRYSLFPRRSAPLRSVPQSLPSLNGAERNTFDNDGNTT